MLNKMFLLYSTDYAFATSFLFFIIPINAKREKFSLFIIKAEYYTACIIKTRFISKMAIICGPRRALVCSMVRVYKHSFSFSFYMILTVSIIRRCT